MKTAILIPAYNPDAKLVELTEQLDAHGLPLLVVNDGSPDEFTPIFRRLRCAVLTHETNRGKGQALKTGLKHLYETRPDTAGVVTADADGQHTVGDILKVIAAMETNPGHMVLGARSFTGNVPFRSRFGNWITRHVFRFLSGLYVSDTQSGLRGIPRSLIPDLLVLPGDRYEYELVMLAALRFLRVGLTEVPIETIYIESNKSSHFNPVADSYKIYAALVTYLRTAKSNRS